MFGAMQAFAQTDPASISRIVSALKGKYPDLSKYCQLEATERKNAVVGAVMEVAIAAKGKLANPVEQGLEAGHQVANECGIEYSAATAADLEKMNPAEIATSATKAPDLVFPTTVSQLTANTPSRMAIFKPEGAGPFPALVWMHHCSALAQDPNIVFWARESVARGYVAFMVDSLGPRNVETICYGMLGDINFERGTKDALQAAEHLRRFDFVDPNRIAVSGFSWGGMIGAMASSKVVAEALKPAEKRFAAAVAFYPACVKGLGVARADVDRPLLLLMGDADKESPPQECVDGFAAAKAANAPIDWHIYPGMTHCWDCKAQDGLKRRDARGTEVVYRYNEAATKDAANRTFEFLGRVMGPAR